MSGVKKWVGTWANESDLKPDEKQGLKWVLDGTKASELATWVAAAANGALSSSWVADVVEKDPNVLAVETLENLKKDLAVAIAEFEIITWTEYLVIEEWMMAVDIWWLDMTFPSATPEDIDIFVLFPMVHEYDKEWQIAFFKWLLERIKTLSPQVKAYILWLNELAKIKYPKDFSKGADIKVAEDNQKQYEKILGDIVNLFNGDGLEWNIKALKYLFETYVVNWNTKASLDQFFVDLSTNPRFSSDWHK